ncbi:hypothetical protein V8F20_003653 [Naviculisporaceae sp. PSN 640]
MMAPPKGKKTKTSAKPKKGKKGQEHDPSYKPPKEPDQSEDTEGSQDLTDSSLEKPSWPKASSTIKSKGVKKTSKKKQSKKGAASTGGEESQASQHEISPKAPTPPPPPSPPPAPSTSASAAPGNQSSSVQPPDSQLKGSHSPTPPPSGLPRPFLPPPDPKIELMGLEWDHGYKPEPPRPQVPGLEAIFDTTSGGKPPPRPSSKKNQTRFSSGMFDSPPPPSRPASMKPQKKHKPSTDSDISDDEVPPWMRERNKKRRMPEIPGFGDIFEANRPATKHYSYFQDHELSTSKPRPPPTKTILNTTTGLPPHEHKEVIKPDVQIEVVKPTIKEETPEPPGTIPPVTIEPGLLRNRDWPPYPGTIYCKKCFYHDCFRAIELRRLTSHVLKLLEEGETWFIGYVYEAFTHKPPLLPEQFVKSSFNQRIPGDLTGLNVLEVVVEKFEGGSPQVTKPNPETQAEIDRSLAGIRDLLNLSETQFNHINQRWQRAIQDSKNEIQAAKIDCHALHPPSYEEVELIKNLVLEELRRVLKGWPSGPDDKETFKFDQEKLGLEINRAYSTLGPAAPKNNSIHQWPYRQLECSYCLQSGAWHRAKAQRGYPRDMVADARRPWAESLHNRFPAEYDIDGKCINPLSKDEGRIKNVKEFLDYLRQEEGARDASALGIDFLVCGDHQDKEKDTMFVLVNMPTIVDVVEGWALDFAMTLDVKAG